MENLNLKKNRGIEKMKKTKMILIVTLGICMLSFMPVVVGKADSRPIEDFTATNAYVAAWLDPESGLTIFPHGFWVTPSGLETIADCEYHGSILERDLKDGRILYKVSLHVKGASLMVFWNEPDWHLIWKPIFVGTMDYYFTTTIIVEGELGDPVPNLWDVWFFGGGETLRSQISGSGTGEFTNNVNDYNLDFNPGDSAKLKIVQVGISKPKGEVWPVEVLHFH